MIHEIKHCRLCRSTQLVTVLSLGEQALTGVFPPSKKDNIPTGPLVLIKCQECGLVQLQHSYEPEQLYGAHYGYRSGLNQSMVQHLKKKVHELLTLAPLKQGDVVVDIGSNDGTTLGFYKTNQATLMGFDPSAEKFKKYYRSDIQLVTDFFSAATFQKIMGQKKANIVTSISMFYDLEEPLAFVEQVYAILADEGIWHLEQSYLPSMLQTNAYDTICHEHLEYYALKQIKWMADRVGFKIIGLEKNNINGGSFAITLAKKESSYSEASAAVNAMLNEETRLGLDTMDIYKNFEARIAKQRTGLVALLQRLKKENKKVYGYGASTKGNVILQHCGINESLLPYIAEVNPDKFGHFTPGTQIPILSEKEIHAMKPDYLFVLPWHFKDNILAREQAYLNQGGKFIFSHPELEIVGK